jgi:hypothetical protein
MVRRWFLIVLGVSVLCSCAAVWAAGLVFGPPMDVPTSSPGTGGLTLGPPIRSDPSPLSPGGLTLPPRIPVVALPLPPEPPLMRPPAPSPTEAVGPHCGCLVWKFAPNPDLEFFSISVSHTSGTYTEDDIRAMPSSTDREYPCQDLLLGSKGTYYAVIQAVGIDRDAGKILTSEYSNEICLTVQNRQIYACPGTKTMVGPCTDSPAITSVSHR